MKKPSFIKTNPNPFIKCKDHTVSRETFLLLEDEDLEMLVTSPKPDESELSKYYESEDYISHTDSKTTLTDNIYFIAKQFAIRKKVKLISKFNTQEKKPNTILDIGCGTGDFLVACQNKNLTVKGVEPNKKARNSAGKKLFIPFSNSNNNKAKVVNSIKQLDKNKYNFITMWHVLEHVYNLEEHIKTLKQLLKPNGTLFIAVPNHKSYDAKHYKEFWAAYDVPRHLWHFSQKSIKLIFEKENMKVVKTIPMKLDSFYVSLLSEKYKTGKQNYFRAFYYGLKSNIKAKHTKEYSSLIYVIKNK